MQMSRHLTIKQPFDLQLTLTMGQAFRWRRICRGENYWWSGVLGSHLVHIRQTNEGVEYRAGGPDGEQEDLDLGEGLRRYFGDDKPIRDIYESINNDMQVCQIVQRYPGMRVLKQEPFECLVSYIASQASSIDRTRNIVEALAGRSGYELELAGEVRHSFPSPKTLIDVGAEPLQNLNPSFRFRKKQPETIVKVAERVLTCTLEWSTLAAESYSKAIQTLRETKGVSYKTANCVALMALGKSEAFPVDRWVQKAMQCWYKDFPTPTRWDYPSRKDHDAMVGWASDRFGPYAGYAGQYLFHGIAPNKARKELQPSLDAPRHENRRVPCPRCGVGVGEVCHYPSGYRYKQGHSERIP